MHFEAGRSCSVNPFLEMLTPFSRMFEGMTETQPKRGRKRAAEFEDDNDIGTWGLVRLKKKCAELGIRGMSNASRDECVTILRSKCQAPALASSAPVTVVPAVSSEEAIGRKTADCVPRLLNIMFSDAILPRTLRCEQSADRQDLDAGSIGHSSRFWTDVHRLFIEPSHKTGNTNII